MKNKPIWHSAQEIPLFDDTVVFIDDLNNWHTGYTQRDNDGITDHDSGEIYTEENILRWIYIKDLLTLEPELDRTRKVLVAAVDVLKDIDELLSSNKFDVREVPLLNITQTKISMLLKCINIEQKESAFVHNKIKFPEYNDGLLEEFDKQFFENGQDDI